MMDSPLNASVPGCLVASMPSAFVPSSGYRVWTRATVVGLGGLVVMGECWRLATVEVFPTCFDAAAWAGGIDGELLIAPSSVTPAGAEPASAHAVRQGAARD
jgi:hypothetical protein